MRNLFMLALVLGACGPVRPVSEGPGCHYVACGDMIDGHDEPRCIVVVDNRSVANYATGQEALDFIRRNDLKTCSADDGK